MEYVYLLKSNKKSLLKIGKTCNLESRMKQFHTTSRHIGNIGEKFEYIRTIRVENSSLLESLLHKKFSGKRNVGEWFDICEDEFDDAVSEIDLESLRTIYKENDENIDVLKKALFPFSCFDVKYDKFDRPKFSIGVISNIGNDVIDLLKKANIIESVNDYIDVSDVGCSLYVIFNFINYEMYTKKFALDKIIIPTINNIIKYVSAIDVYDIILDEAYTKEEISYIVHESDMNGYLDNSLFM